MIGPGTGVRVYLACGVTDMMGWTPPLAQRQTEGLASQGEQHDHFRYRHRHRQARVPVAWR